MATQPSLSAEQAQALAAFDAERDAFLSAFAQAPDEALAYVPPGDEYAVGTLLPHLCDPIDRYLDVLARLRRADFGPVDLSTDGERAAREARRHAALAALRPTGAERPRLLAELDAAHGRARDAISAVDGATFTRQAPVTYSSGTEPYPTSAGDILGWLTDHYREHTVQIQAMLATWWDGSSI